MEHRICVCVAAIGVATIGHQAQAAVNGVGASVPSEFLFPGSTDSYGFAIELDADSVGVNAIGVEMLPYLDPDDTTFDPNVDITGEPAVGSVPFDDPAFTDLSESSWSNLDPSGLPPGPERAAAFGENFVGTDGADPFDDKLTFRIDFSSLSDGDQFAFALFFFEEGEETSQNSANRIFNVYQGSDGTFTSVPSVLIGENTRTRADFGMSVIPMPHPAGMAGVGLAGVAMVRRRRSV